MSKKILMNGITGLLGSHLAKALLNKGHELIALKKKSSSLQRIESISASTMDSQQGSGHF